MAGERIHDRESGLSTLENPYTNPDAASSGGTSSASLPQITAPPPSSITQKPELSAPRVVPGAKGSKGAAIAYGIDSVLRGFIKGRADAEQKKAYKANRLMQGLQFSYQNDAKLYSGYIQSNPDVAAKLSELQQLTAAPMPAQPPQQQAPPQQSQSSPQQDSTVKPPHDASGLPDGTTATGQNNERFIVRGGQWHLPE
jgi:hypothetical protein